MVCLSVLHYTSLCISCDKNLGEFLMLCFVLWALCYSFLSIKIYVCTWVNFLFVNNIDFSEKAVDESSKQCTYEHTCENYCYRWPCRAQANNIDSSEKAIDAYSWSSSNTNKTCEWIKKEVEEETKGTNLLLFRGTWSRNYILQPLHFSNPVPGKTGIHNKVHV